MKWLVLAPAFVLFACATPAHDDGTNAQRCFNVTVDPDHRIAACTRLIDSGPLPENATALAYVGRGVGYATKRQYDRAMADFNTVIKFKPDNALASSTSRSLSGNSTDAQCQMFKASSKSCTAMQ